MAGAVFCAPNVSVFASRLIIGLSLLASLIVRAPSQPVQHASQIKISHGHDGCESTFGPYLKRIKE